MISIQNLHAQVDSNPILQGINLTINAGEIHAIMGPNGAGKSTLANILAGRSNYHITQGEIRYQQQDLLSLTPEQRAQAGIFLAFQYPIEIPGISNITFLKTAFNALRLAREEPTLDAIEFMNYVREKLALVEMDETLLYRSLNEGFSGGEKKRNEVLQMAVLEPKFAILDETDSGLDIDAMKTVAKGVNQLRSPERAMLIVTHYQRLLDYIVPDYVHVLAQGKIVKSGGKELALTLEQQGYTWIEAGATS